MEIDSMKIEYLLRLQDLNDPTYEDPNPLKVYEDSLKQTIEETIETNKKIDRFKLRLIKRTIQEETII